MANYNYTSDSSDSDSNSSRSIDIAYLLLDIETVENNFEEHVKKCTHLEVEKLILHHNQLSVLPANINKFSNTRILDISNNGLKVLPNVLEYLPLTTLVAKNNLLNNSSLPKCFKNHSSLLELNLSGNQIRHFPEQILDFVNLKFLCLGGNKMQQISKNIWKLKK